MPEQNRLTVGRSIADLLQLRRKFATAGELLVGFANSFVWEFTGGDANLTSSIAKLLAGPAAVAGRRAEHRPGAVDDRGTRAAGEPAGLRAVSSGILHARRDRRIGRLRSVAPRRFPGRHRLDGLLRHGGRRSGRRGCGHRLRAERASAPAAAAAAAAARGSPAAAQARWAATSVLLQQLQQIRNTQDSLNLQAAHAGTAGGVSGGRRDRSGPGRPVPAEHRNRAGHVAPGPKLVVADPRQLS